MSFESNLIQVSITFSILIYFDSSRPRDPSQSESVFPIK